MNILHRRILRRRKLCSGHASMACLAVIVCCADASAEPLDSGISRRQVETRSYLSYATESLDTMMQYGTDRYGSVQSDLLVSNLDVTTKNNPLAGGLAAADEAWRTDRRQRRAPGGANFLHNQSIYSAMKSASLATGDNSYSNFVDSNFDWALGNLVDSNGLFWWGYHRHYDVHTDSFVSDGDNHEMHFVDIPLWDDMWNRNAAAVQTEIETIWDRHVVDKGTGHINRHDFPGGLSFITSSASFIDAFAFLSSKTTGTTQLQWLDRAKLLANYNWNDRHPTTNLLAHTPNENERWDGLRSATTTPAVYVPALLRAYEFTGDTLFRDQALTYLESWAQYAYDPASGSFWASLELDGTPVPGPWAQSGYARYEPRGLVDLWAPEFITAQYNPDAAKTYALAFAQLGDADLLDTAEKWATLVRKNLPATETLLDTWYGTYGEEWAPHGTYAEHYGHLVEFFVTLHDETGEEHYLFSARDLAKEAISSLWYEGLFRGHPNKPYFEAVDGVGVLVDSLIQLDGYSASFTKFGDFDGDNDVDMTDFQTLLGNWRKQVAPYEDGDVSGDGFVDLLDFERFKHEYFEGDSSELAATGVPEPPAIILLLGLCGLAIFAQRFKHSVSRGAVVFCLLLIGLLCISRTGTAQVLDSGVSRGDVENRSYLSWSTEVLDNLMIYGTDRYGSEQSDLLVTILDVRTKETTIPDYGDTYWRADTRFERRSPQGANFLQSQPLLRTLYRVSDITGDGTYASFANSNINYALNNLVDGNGMFQWGWHRWYDVVTDEFKSDGDNHEMHFVNQPEWERMWAQNPSAVQTEIEQIWNRHVVNKNTGQINRHDHGGTGVSFIMTSASFIEATAFLSTKVPGSIPGESDHTIDTWLERSRRLANYPWSRRDPTTNLVAHIPNQGLNREDEFVAFTTMHLLSLGLLEAYEHTGDTTFRDQAVAYLEAYATYGYDSQAETYWGTLALDGTPDTSAREGGLIAFPTGHIDFWQPNVIDREFPAEAAQAYAKAFALTGDATMRLNADRFAKLIRETAATKETLLQSIYGEYSESWAPLGTYAEHYGRTIDFFITMYDHTGEGHYLSSARDLAKDAVSSLYYEGLFRGHPNKPYYEELDGVPLLLEALVELDQYADQFDLIGDFDGNHVVDMDDYATLLSNWQQEVTPFEDGDVTGDGLVNIYDFDRFKHEYFGTASPPSQGTQAVPEANTAGLLAIGALVALGTYRRQLVTCIGRR
ncbi:hypothetical protein [Aeoliella sp.]|uniref:hypothetical protein n=1 Tax=Aeoliella sp. TaxID=2795800 RepID=UPI003CCBCA73